MKVLHRVIVSILLVLFGGCANEQHLYSGFDPNAIMKYGYPQQEDWARIRGERKPIQAAPVCQSVEFKKLTDWAKELGGKCEFSGSSCSCESSRGVRRDSNPRVTSVEGDGAIMRAIAEKTVKKFDCPTAYTERREFRLQVNTQDNWGWTFKVRHECSTQ